MQLPNEVVAALRKESMQLLKATQEKLQFAAMIVKRENGVDFEVYQPELSKKQLTLLLMSLDLLDVDEVEDGVGEVNELMSRPNNAKIGQA